MNTQAMIALTPREIDVLRLLAGGCTYPQIAVRLGVSPHTVVSHIKNAYRKLDVHSGAAAVMRAIQLGLSLSPAIAGWCDAPLPHTMKRGNK